MRRASLLIMITLLFCAAAFAQAPAAPAAPAASPQAAAPKTTPAPAGAVGGIAVIDFMRAVTGNGEGTKASNRLQAEFAKRQNAVAAKQKEGQDATAKLQAGEKVLSEAVKADLAKQIDRVNTDLTRMSDDYQKEMADLQQTQLAPIATVVRSVMEKYAAEKGFAVVFNSSSDASNIIWNNPAVDITQDIIIRVDEETAKTPVKPATGAPATPPKPSTPAAPKPPTPDPTKKP